MPRQAECTSKSEEERCFAAPLVYSPSWSGPDHPVGVTLGPEAIGLS